MSPKQYKKVKLFRALKILFYCCGLPLFVLAVFFTAVKFIGHDPFNGQATFTESINMMQSYERTLAGSSLYGVWCAFGIWAIIAVFQIIFAKTIKNRRARMFATVAITLVLMLGALLVVDTLYARKIDGFTNPITGEHTNGLRDDLSDGVTVEDYRTQLSYYRTISTEAAKKDLSKNLIEQIDLLKRVYNVKMEGKDKIGSAGSVSNDPITYATIIDDDGNMGVDISFKDGKLQLEEVNKRTVEHKALLGGTTGTVVDDNVLIGDDGTGSGKNWKWGTELPIYWDPSKEDYLNRHGKLCQEANQVVRLCPNEKGELVINGKVYSHYVAVARADMANQEYYVWYARDLFPKNYDFENHKGVLTDGVYGPALYNNNGNIADGWIFSFENVLEILEDYYECPVEVNKIIQDNKMTDSYETQHAKLIAAAAERRLAYYTAETTDPWERALYKQETYNKNKFSFTHYRLDALLAEVGNMLGRNYLFDYLLAPDTLIGGIIAPFLSPFRSGTKLLDYLKSQFGLGEDTCNTVLGVLQKIAGDDTLTDVYVKLSYPSTGEEGHFMIVIKPNAGDATLTAEEKGTFTGQRYALVGEDEYVVASNGNYKKSGSTYVELTAEERGTFTGKRYTYNSSTKKYTEDSQGTYKDCMPIIDIDFSNELLEYQEDNPDFAFDLDHLSAFINSTLGKFVDLSSMKGTLNTVLGLVGGMIKALDTSNGVALNITLLGSNVHIQLLDKDYNFALDIDEILLTFLDGLYYYESSAIQPLWNFYLDPDETDQNKIDIANYFTAMDRAEFTGTKYGSLIGSTLIGKTLGATMAMSGGVSYDSKYGLTDLTAVKQLKTDLSYMPTSFPIYGFRDMVALFSGMVVLFVFLSYYAAEREYLYATGKLVPRARKRDKDLLAEDEGENANAEGEEPAADAPLEELPPPEEPAPNAPPEDIAPEEAPQEDGKKAKKAKKEKEKKEKKSKKGKGEPELEEGADVPVPEESDKEVLGR